MFYIGSKIEVVQECVVPVDVYAGPVVVWLSPK